jgi:hypothetical protein
VRAVPLALLALALLSGPASGQELPEGPEVRGALEDILSSGEYDTSRPGASQISVWEWILRQIRKLLSSLAGLGQASPLLFWLILASCLVILAAIFAHGAYVLVGALRAARARTALTPEGAAVRFDDPQALLERARKAAAEGRYTEAVRLCHRAALLGMDRRGLVRFHESFTCGDYRRQLRGHTRERASFDALARVYEPAYFGKVPVGKAEFAECARVSGALAGEVIVGGLALMVASILLFARRPRGLGYDPEEAKQGSSRFTTPAGGKALYVLLRRMGVDLYRHERRLELVGQDTRAVFLWAANPLSQEEVGWAVDWVSRQGGTIVWCPRRGAEPGPLLEAFGLELKGRPGPESETVRATLEALDPSLEKPYKLVVGVGRRLAAKGDAKASWRIIAQDGRGEVVAAVVSRGVGRFVALADPRLFGNAGLAAADHAEFMVHLAILVAGGGRAALDEYHHGFTEGQSAFAILWDSSVAPAVGLGIAAALAGVFAGGRRLGPPVDLREGRRRRPTEFMDAFAGLCRKMKAAPAVMGVILAEFRMFLLRHYGAADPEAAARLETWAGLPPGSVPETLDRAHWLASAPGASDADFLACCRQLEEVRGALQRTSARRKAK